LSKFTAQVDGRGAFVPPWATRKNVSGSNPSERPRPPPPPTSAKNTRVGAEGRGSGRQSGAGCGPRRRAGISTRFDHRRQGRRSGAAGVADGAGRWAGVPLWGPSVASAVSVQRVKQGQLIPLPAQDGASFVGVAVKCVTSFLDKCRQFSNQDRPRLI